MRNPYLTPKLDTTIDDLTQRNELFQLIQDSLQWMDETNDPKIKEMHRALADLFQTTWSSMKFFWMHSKTSAEFAEQ